MRNVTFLVGEFGRNPEQSLLAGLLSGSGALAPAQQKGAFQSAQLLKPHVL
jgi:hypothetical protein